MQRRTNSGEAKFIVNVSDIRKKLGDSTSVDIEMVFVGLKVIDTVLSEKPIKGTLLLKSVDRGILVTGDLTFEWKSNCRRCLETIIEHVVIAVDDHYMVDAPEDSESISFDGVHIDLGPVVRDSVVTALPLVPLCSDSCEGPDPKRYPTLIGERQRVEGLTDPRWSELDKLKFE